MAARNEPVVVADPAVLAGLDHYQSLPIKQQPTWTDAAKVASVREQLAEVTVPTLVIAGDHDPSISADAVRELMAGLPNAKLFVVEGGRHLAVVDFPHEVGAALNTFWSSIH